ncbi:MAG: redoxin domain-containing protein [Dehalococcoidia bacterium]|nr:redoxin domain-containing protein [Dehalococcoidia bacterium]
MNSVSLRSASRTVLLPLLAVMLTAVAGCSGGEETPPAPTSAEEIGLQEVAIEAPDFTLPTMGGGQLKLSDLRGQIVLLNFWQLDCPPCKDEMPLLDAAGKAYKGTAHIVALDIGDSESSIAQYFDDATLNMAVPYDRDGRTAAMYSIGFTPTTFLIDKEGIIRYVKVGSFASYGEVVAAIEFTRLKEAA